jgi:hypothetical protein
MPDELTTSTTAGDFLDKIKSTTQSTEKSLQKAKAMMKK